MKEMKKRVRKEKNVFIGRVAIQSSVIADLYHQLKKHDLVLEELVDFQSMESSLAYRTHVVRWVIKVLEFHEDKKGSN